MGINKVQDQWHSEDYKVSRAPSHNVFMIEPADCFRHTRMLNRVELRLYRSSPPVVKGDVPSLTSDVPAGRQRQISNDMSDSSSNSSTYKRNVQQRHVSDSNTSSVCLEPAVVEKRNTRHLTYAVCQRRVI